MAGDVLLNNPFKITLMASVHFKKCQPAETNQQLVWTFKKA